MLRPVLALAVFVFVFATVATTVPGCSIAGIADGVYPPDGGVDGAADGGEVGDAGCAADLAHDQANCGRCGRACSGPCDDGTCDVATIADGQGRVDAVATNGIVVAWSSDGRRLRSCPVGGQATPTALTPDFDVTGQLVIDGQSLFYTTGVTSSHSVNECTLPVCKDDDESLGFDLGTPSAVAADQKDVFALETTGRRVLHCGIGGGCGKEIAKNTSADGAIALGLSNVYWSVLDTPGAIYSCPRSGCVGETGGVFAAGQAAPRALAVDGNDVWWSSYDDGTVSSCPLAGCGGAPPRVLAHGQRNPLGLASDSTRVYWANEGDGTIVTCEAAGCATPQVIVKGLERPQWIALDDAHVYFSTAGGWIGSTLK